MGDKTVFMPKKLFEKWYNALRSGKYKQGRGILCKKSKQGNEYCCLGVLEHVAEGKVEREGLPTLTWLHKHKVLFLSSDTTYRACQQDPYLPHLSEQASEANDGCNQDEEKSVPFRSIAAALRKAYGGPIPNEE